MLKALVLAGLTGMLGVSIANADPSFDFSVNSGGFSFNIESPQDTTPLFTDLDAYNEFQRHGRQPKWGERDNGRLQCEKYRVGRKCYRECKRQSAVCYVLGRKNGRNKTISAEAASVRRAKFKAEEKCYRQGYNRCVPRGCEVGETIVSEERVSCRGGNGYDGGGYDGGGYDGGGWDGNQGWDDDNYWN